MRDDSDNLIVRLTFELVLEVVSFLEKIRAKDLKLLHKFLEAVP